MIANLNYVHIAVATLAYFFIGFLWYSVLFGKKWMALLGSTGPTEEDKKNMPKMMVFTLILNFIITFSAACVLHFVWPTTILGALKTGALLGVGFTGATTAMNYMYSKRSFQLTLIDSGYHIVSICVISVILTLWV
jgi:hypothetical protein